MPIQEFENKIKGFWDGLPAVISVKEITRRSQLPKWEDCPKDHLYVGIIRKKNNDRLIVVKHQMAMEVNTAKGWRVERLGNKELLFAGLLPEFKSSGMVCSACGQFSTRINIGQVCTDCLNKKKRAI
ncbi:MAG: hypothetical protein JL50_03135 [Peptococcaceae bacterium BICA1-7]|nr:MAG: hypothetical protein JL50_03135 [Peptococcaceae bacterium BICA1-7]HBV97741.1 hypothetical protein [Desulfotomaculum sp.]